jgi:hypothetical protein
LSNTKESGYLMIELVLEMSWKERGSRKEPQGIVGFVWEVRYISFMLVISNIPRKIKSTHVRKVD